MSKRSAIKPGVGEVILTTRWWRPKTVTKVRFRPVGTQLLHRVNPEAVGDLLTAQSMEQAMSVVRRSEASPH